MIDYKQFLLALDQIAEEKGISKEKVIETLEAAIAAAYKKDYGKKDEIIRTKFDVESGKFEVFQIKLVVDESMLKKEDEADDDAPLKENELETGVRKVRFNAHRHIMLEEAKKIRNGIDAGEELMFPLPFHEEFGRIAAQTAKQVITQRIREAERSAVHKEFKAREGELISAVVQRVEGKNVFLDLGRTVGIMFPEEQIPREFYRVGARIRALIVNVQSHPRGPSIVLSRAHPRFVAKLFEFEVPEVAAGTVEIKGIAREPGSRTKVAVISKEKGVDPIGSLVGQRGTRVATIINELGGEKIDIVDFVEDQAQFIAKALSPAKKILNVELNEALREARVTVPENELSLAIGRGGQNVRLAARLTGWKIDVRSEAAPDTPQEEGVAEAPAEETPIEAPHMRVEGNKEIINDGVEIMRGNEEKKPAEQNNAKTAEKDKSKKKRTVKKKVE